MKLYETSSAHATQKFDEFPARSSSRVAQAEWAAEGADGIYNTL